MRMPRKLVDRIANASFVIGLLSAAGFAAVSGNPMSGNVVVVTALTVFAILCALEMHARHRAGHNPQT